MPDNQNVLILGLGNEFRRDDGVGLWVANQIAAADWPRVTARALDAGDTASLLSAWEGAKMAYLIDAVRADAAPGTIVRIGGRQLALPDRPRFLSSHGLGLEEAIALGDTLGIRPERVIVYGIVGRDFEPGQGLSPEVERAARAVIRRLKRVCLTNGAGRQMAGQGEGVPRSPKRMHEQSLMKALVNQVTDLARQHQAQRVRKVVVRTGALSHGNAERLEDHFRQAAQGTVLADAILEVESTEELIDLALSTVELETPDT